MSFLPLAYNTHREAIRDKILYIILVFAILLITSGILLSYLSLQQEDKIVLDLGLSSMNIFALLITIFIGTTLLHKEIEGKTIYLLLTKPLRRSSFILGKYFGLSLTLALVLLLMAVAFYGVFWYITGFDLSSLIDILPATGQAILFIYIEMLVLVAFAIFFSSFSSSVMSAVFTLGIYIIGHLTQDIVNFGLLSKDEALMTLTRVLYYVLPDLERLNLKNYVLFGGGVGLDTLLSSVGYGLLYSAVLLILSMLIFESREF